MTLRPSRALARILSKQGAASRSEASAWIAAGRINVNGSVITDADYCVPDNACISVDGHELSAARKLYYMLNKPRGLVTTTHDEQGRATVYECLPQELRAKLAPVGRLDKASEGLLLFSNDTAWSSRILAPTSQLAKIYHVQINQLPTASLMHTLQGGVQCAGDYLELTALRELRRGEKNAWLEITLSAGKNRHIRRMLKVCGVAVLRLLRVEIGPLQLGQLPKGQCRALHSDELKHLEQVLFGHVV